MVSYSSADGKKTRNGRQVNEPAHKSHIVINKIHDLMFEFVDDLPYSLNLAPSDYYLLSKTEKEYESAQVFFQGSYGSCRKLISRPEEFF